MNVMPHDEYVIDARRGRVISVSYAGTPPVADEQSSAVKMQVPRGQVAMGYSSSKLILAGKNVLIDFAFAEVTEIWLARPATIQICIGASPGVSVRWKDHAKSGIGEFAGRLAYAREARFAETGLQIPTIRSPIEDPLERLWRRAQEIRWSNRADKKDLQQIAPLLSPEESVLGVCRLSVALTESYVLAVTSQNLYLSGKLSKENWRKLHDEIPVRFRTTERALSIPLTTVERCVVTNGVFILQITGEPVIRFVLTFANTQDIESYVVRFLKTARSVH